MMIEREIKKYLTEVKRCLPIHKRSRLIRELESNIDVFLQNHPGASMEDIKNHFGEPYRFAEEYYLSEEDLPGHHFTSNVTLVKRWLIIVAVIIILIFVIIAGLTAISIYRYNAQSAGYYYSITIDN